MRSVRLHLRLSSRAKGCRKIKDKRNKPRIAEKTRFLSPRWLKAEASKQRKSAVEKRRLLDRESPVVSMSKDYGKLVGGS